MALDRPRGLRPPQGLRIRAPGPVNDRGVAGRGHAGLPRGAGRHGATGHARRLGPRARTSRPGPRPRSARPSPSLDRPFPTSSRSPGGSCGCTPSRGWPSPRRARRAARRSRRSPPRPTRSSPPPAAPSPPHRVGPRAGRDAVRHAAGAGRCRQVPRAFRGRGDPRGGHRSGPAGRWRSSTAAAAWWTGCSSGCARTA